jgi:segregation and condensation protein A
MTDILRPGYQVTLPIFEGPLDLLLHLIERQELDITEVSLAQVTNQYIEYLAEISERDPDHLADFMVVAAKLLLIKSRVLLPQPPAAASSDEEPDPDDLVRRLVEYKRFKEASRWLQDLESQGLQSYIRMAAPPRLEHSVDLGNVTLDELLAAVRQVLVVTPPGPSVNGTVAPISVTMSGQMNLIERETRRRRAVSFRRLLEQAESRLEIIVTLLALLEMVKQQRVTMRQADSFGDILIVAEDTPTSSSSLQPDRTQDGTA